MHLAIRSGKDMGSSFVFLLSQVRTMLTQLTPLIAEFSGAGWGRENCDDV